MSESHAHYWEDLSQWFSFALHQLVYIPACCIHAIERELKAKHGAPKILHRPHEHSKNHPINQLEIATNSTDHLEKASIHDQPHFCRNCGEDIISRVHSSRAHEHTKIENDSFHDWLSNDQPRLDVNEAIPHASAYEPNLDGFNEEHLQRIEKYWTEHQLSSPNCAVKAAKLATAADWEKTKQQSIENSRNEY